MDANTMTVDQAVKLLADVERNPHVKPVSKIGVMRVSKQAKAIADLIESLASENAELKRQVAELEAGAAAMRCCANCDSYGHVNCELRPEEVCDNWRSDGFAKGIRAKGEGE